MNHNDYGAVRGERDQLRAQNVRLQDALVKAAIPLEVLVADEAANGRIWDISPTLRDSIHAGVAAIRGVLQANPDAGLADTEATLRLKIATWEGEFHRMVALIADDAFAEGKSLDEYRDAIWAAHVGAKTTPRTAAWDHAWVIEDSRAPGRYYAGNEWTTDHMRAIRYVREYDAWAAILALPDGEHLIGSPKQYRGLRGGSNMAEAASATGRLSSRDPHLQNIPMRADPERPNA